MRQRKWILLMGAAVFTGTYFIYKRIEVLQKRKTDRKKEETEERTIFRRETIEEHSLRPLRLHRDNEADREDLITLQDSDGRDVTFEFLDMIRYRGNDYAVLLPYPYHEEPVVILRECRDESADPRYDVYETVEDPETLDAVFEIFRFKFRGEYEFID